MIWLLQAKEFPDDDRSLEARSARFYLKPGTYVVGRSTAQCDISVVDDQSISRHHAELVVGAVPDERASVIVRDSSRYGTLVTPSNSGLEAQGTEKESRACDGYYIKFGFKSPFRLQNLEWSLFVLDEEFSDEEQHRVEQKAAILGIPVERTLRSGHTKVICPAAISHLSSSLLLAMLLNVPCVTEEWVDTWLEHAGPWVNACPEESQFQPAYAASGRTQALATQATMVQDLARQQPLKGTHFVWDTRVGTLTARHLQMALERFGASTEVSGAESTCHVLPDEEEKSMQGPFEQWTTPRRILDAIAFGKPLQEALMIQDSMSDHNTGLVCNDSDQETPSPTKLRRHPNKRQRKMDGASTIQLDGGGSPIPGLGGDVFMRRRVDDAGSKCEEDDDIIPASPDERATPCHNNDDDERTASETVEPHPVASQQVKQWAGRATAEENTSRDMGSVVYGNLLVVPTPRQHTQARTRGSGSELPNFKAFRRRGGELAIHDAVVDDYEANPYTEAAAISNTFLQEAATREKAHQLAEELFTKEMRASKAPTTTKRPTGRK